MELYIIVFSQNGYGEDFSRGKSVEASAARSPRWLTLGQVQVQNVGRAAPRGARIWETPLDLMPRIHASWPAIWHSAHPFSFPPNRTDLPKLHLIVFVSLFPLIFKTHALFHRFSKLPKSILKRLFKNEMAGFILLSDPRTLHGANPAPIQNICRRSNLPGMLVFSWGQSPPDTLRLMSPFSSKAGTDDRLAGGHLFFDERVTPHQKNKF